MCVDQSLVWQTPAVSKKLGGLDRLADPPPTLRSSMNEFPWSNLPQSQHPKGVCGAGRIEMAETDWASEVQPLESSHKRHTGQFIQSLCCFHVLRIFYFLLLNTSRNNKRILTIKEWAIHNLICVCVCVLVFPVLVDLWKYIYIITIMS